MPDKLGVLFGVALILLGLFVLDGSIFLTDPSRTAPIIGGGSLLALGLTTLCTIAQNWLQGKDR